MSPTIVSVAASIDVSEASRTKMPMGMRERMNANAAWEDSCQ